jgi:uncharacterized glyoxalase superfamily protein PhnB
LTKELTLIRVLYPDDGLDASVLRGEKLRLLRSISPSVLGAAPAGAPRIIPYLIYDDVSAAIAWLDRAFGFREREESRVLEADGTIGHAEMEVAEAQIMLGPPSIHGESPQRGVSTMLHVYIDSVDRHCERARAAGATIVLEPEDQPWGQRRYQATDPEGHQWHFAQRIR